jgi:hypothetical protein
VLFVNAEYLRGESCCLLFFGAHVTLSARGA